MPESKDMADIIKAEVDKVEGREPEPLDDSGNEPDSAPVVDDPEVEPVDPETKPEDDSKPKDETDDDPELTKLLEEHGFKAAAKGQRENKIPYSRVRKIVGNAIKKIKTGHSDELTKREKDALGFKTRAGEADAWDRAIATDPDRVVAHLAALYPDKWGKYTKPAATETPAAALPKAEEDPMPEPDGEDGSYTKKGLKALLDWNRREAVRESDTRIRKEYQGKFGTLDTIERERRAKAAVAAQQPIIDAKLSALRTTWGKLFTDDEELAKTGKSEILAAAVADRTAAVAERRPVLPFEVIVAQVLLPKMQLTQDQQRTKLIKEMNDRKKAAKTVPTNTTKVVDDGGPKGTEDIIRESLAKAGLLGK
jgi:hypothetical protein